MSAATILFTDVVSFSKKPTAEQKKLVEGLTSEVTHELRPLLNPPFDYPSIISLPTGDGLALAFLHKPNKQWNRSTILNMIFRLQKWASVNSIPGNEIKIRIGIHVGAVEIISDINNKPNVCGDTINYAQRVMDAANPRQTLFSEAAFREYVGTEHASCTLHSMSENLEFAFDGPIEVFAKHRLQIRVYKMTSKAALPYWNNIDPEAKHQMLVSLTSLPKEIAGSFKDNVEEATNLAFIQLTGERFLDKFKDGEIKLSNELKRFWVFMPAPDTYKNLELNASKASPKYVQKMIERWIEFFEKLREQYPSADLKLGAFKEPPYFGASFLDWERPEGKIHVSPYVWGVAANMCPGYDLEWIGKKPLPVYETYVQGLRYLNDISENILKNKIK